MRLCPKATQIRNEGTGAIWMANGMGGRILATTKVVAVVVTVALGAMCALVICSSLLRHEVTRSSDDTASVEGWIPVLSGHVTAADWGMTYMSDPLPVVPGPTDYEMAGTATIDGEASEALLAGYDWNPLPDGTDEGGWLRSPEFEKTLAPSVMGRVLFDGGDTIWFSLARF